MIETKKRVTWRPSPLESPAGSCRMRTSRSVPTSGRSADRTPRLGPRLSGCVARKSGSTVCTPSTCSSLKSAAIDFKALEAMVPATPTIPSDTSQFESTDESEVNSETSVGQVCEADLTSKITRAEISGCAKRWRQGELLGAGAFGKVFLAQDPDTGSIFAVKVSRVRERDERSQEFCTKLQEELRICQDLRHKHIVSCLGHSYEHGRLEIYLEYVAGGSLRRMLEQFGPLEGLMLRKAARGLLEGLEYLHGHRPPVVHRDLKGANVLVDLDFCVKLADFGCAKRDTGTKSFSTLGTLHWMAPEVVKASCGHGRKADIWSFGCVMIEMVTARDPWGDGVFSNIMHAMHVIRSDGALPPMPDGILQEDRRDGGSHAYDLVMSSLQREPDRRPWASELLQNAFLQDLDSSCNTSIPEPSCGRGTERSGTIDGRSTTELRLGLVVLLGWALVCISSFSSWQQHL